MEMEKQITDISLIIDRARVIDENELRNSRLAAVRIIAYLKYDPKLINFEIDQLD